MSAALVPGLILLRAVSSGLIELSACCSAVLFDTEGLGGPNWNSGIGGGEGNRGELPGEPGNWEAVVAMSRSNTCHQPGMTGVRCSATTRPVSHSQPYQGRH